MKNPEKSVKVVAVNNYKVHSMFDIYLMIDGKREWLMSHRHNGVLFKMLEGGVKVNELRNAKGWRKDQVRYLLKVIDGYLKEEAIA